MAKKPKILILDHSVIAQKAFWRIFSAEYQGETNDEKHEFVSQYVHEIVYLNALHKPKGILWVLDCPRAEVWRHKIVRNYYGPLLNAWASQWEPMMDRQERTPDNATEWVTECDNMYKIVTIDSDGNYHGKHMAKKDFTAWVADTDNDDENEIDGLPVVRGMEKLDHRKVSNKKTLKALLSKAAPMYKGTREGKHWPASAKELSTSSVFRKFSAELARKIAPQFNGRVAYADQMEADDLAQAAVVEYSDKFSITVVSTDMDWLQLAYQREFVTYWNANKYRFEETDDNNHILKEFIVKLLSGDDSDNIKSVREKGKIAGISEKKARFMVTHEKNPPQWVLDNVDPVLLEKNRSLISLPLAPEWVREKSLSAIRESKREKPTCELTDFVSETTLALAVADGQKERQAQTLMRRKKENEDS